jgi:hypothetical protein
VISERAEADASAAGIQISTGFSPFLNGEPYCSGVANTRPTL